MIYWSCACRLLVRMSSLGPVHGVNQLIGKTKCRGSDHELNSESRLKRSHGCRSASLSTTTASLCGIPYSGERTRDVSYHASQSGRPALLTQGLLRNKLRSSDFSIFHRKRQSLIRCRKASQSRGHGDEQSGARIVTLHARLISILRYAESVSQHLSREDQRSEYIPSSARAPHSYWPLTLPAPSPTTSHRSTPQETFPDSPQVLFRRHTA